MELFTGLTSDYNCSTRFSKLIRYSNATRSQQPPERAILNHIGQCSWKVGGDEWSPRLEQKVPSTSPGVRLSALKYVMHMCVVEEDERVGRSRESTRECAGKCN